MVSGFARFGIVNAFVVLGLSQVAATDATGYRANKSAFRP
jgi:hypothetical protein